MPVSLSISSPVGSYDFADASKEMPLIGRTVGWIRQDDEGPSYRRINVTIQGFFEGLTHADVVAKYQALLAILVANDCVLTYNDGATNVINAQRVYLEGFTDPPDWKQYDGEYTLTMYYFEAHTHPTADLGIAATYVTTSPPVTYTFDPPPLWGRSIIPRQDPNAPLLSPAGAAIGSLATIDLSGFLTATSHAALKTKMDDLQNAFLADGTLNYGSFSQAVKTGPVVFQQSYPRLNVNYSITLTYAINEIITLDLERDFSRLHSHPAIIERHFCGTRRILFGNSSGQFVRYNGTIQASTIANARSLLATEMALFIIPGGIEIEGGSQRENIRNASINLDLTKFYSVPVLANMANT